MNNKLQKGEGNLTSSYCDRFNEGASGSSGVNLPDDQKAEIDTTKKDAKKNVPTNNVQGSRYRLFKFPLINMRRKMAARNTAPSLTKGEFTSTRVGGGGTIKKKK